MPVSVIHEICEQIDKLHVSQNVRILAVSKNQTVDDIKNVLNAGMSLIGENRVQEAALKFPQLNDLVFEKHLIGSLQKNKENNALLLFDVIQSIESFDQLQRIATRLKKNNIKKKVYLQVNTSLEETKHGVRNDKEFFTMVDFVCENKDFLDLQGLMTIGALSEHEKVIRESFSRLRYLKEKIDQKYSLSNLELSMGMSNDFIYAVQEGSTMIRLGRRLFIK